MPLILLGIVVLFCWKLTLTKQFTWLDDPDRANQVLPWFQFQAIQWHSFHIPLWDPNAWTGQPLFGQGQPGSANPLNWLMFLMPMTRGAVSMVVLNWYFVLLRYIAALGCYALCRDLKCSRGASILGACLFGLGGFVANTGWPQMVNGAIWAPLAFLFLFRVERGEHPLANSLLSGFFLGFAWLSGHHQAPFYITLAAIAVWIRMLWRDGRFDWKILRLAAISLIIAVMAGAFQTLPMAEYGERSVRWVGTPDPLPFDARVPYSVHAQYSLKPAELLDVFVPTSDEWNPFIGIVGLALVVLGVLSARQERHVRWLAGLAVAALLFALGPNGYLHGIFYAIVPMIEKSRSPGAGVVVFSLAAAPLAAIGFDRALSLAEERWTSRVLRILAMVGGALILTAAGLAAAGVKHAAGDPRLMIPAIAALAGAALLASRRVLTPRTLAIAGVAIVLFELANVTDVHLAEHGQYYENTPLLRNLSLHNDIAHFLSERADYGRIEYRETDIPYNFGDWFGLETFQSYTASVTTNIWQHEIFDPRVRDIMSIRYSISKEPSRPEQQLVYKGQSGLNVYETPSVFPRVWAVHESAHVVDSNAAREMLGSAKFDARSKVFFVGSGGPELPACADSAADEVKLTLHGANRVDIHAKLACAGMVILNDTYYPGWQATVDGNAAKIEEADGIFRGVAVPAGEHAIEMKYRPMSVIGGGLLSLLAALVAAGAWVKAWNSSPR